MTEQDVINEEMYEEEDDDLPSHYRRLAAHIQTGSSDFNRRLSEYLTTHVAMRDAYYQQFHQQHVHNSQFVNNHGLPTDYTNQPQTQVCICRPSLSLLYLVVYWFKFRTETLTYTHSHRSKCTVLRCIDKLHILSALRIQTCTDVGPRCKTITLLMVLQEVIAGPRCRPQYHQSRHKIRLSQSRPNADPLSLKGLSTLCNSTMSIHSTTQATLAPAIQVALVTQVSKVTTTLR